MGVLVMRLSKMFFRYALAVLTMGVFAAESQAEVSFRNSRGTLRVTGDNSAELVIISGMGSNQVAVETNDGEIYEFEDVEDIRIELKRGADELEIYDLEISGNLDINMGGDMGDSLQVADSMIGGNFVNKGASDSIITDSSIGKNLTIHAGLPYDFFENDCTMEVIGSVVGGKATLNGSNQSSDMVCVSTSFFANDLFIHLGNGSDSLSIFENVIGRNLTMDGGGGSTDLVCSDGNWIGGRIKLRAFELYF